MHLCLGLRIAIMKGIRPRRSNRAPSVNGTTCSRKKDESYYLSLILVYMYVYMYMPTCQGLLGRGVSSLIHNHRSIFNR